MYNNQEESSISSLHAIIQFDRGAFKITDASTNGTKLNGELLENDLPTTLNHGDRIILGDVANQGAQLQFQVVKSKDQSKSAKEKAKSSLSNLNAVDDLEAAEKIEVIKQEPEANDQVGKTKNQPADDENWMDSLE